MSLFKKNNPAICPHFWGFRVSGRYGAVFFMYLNSSVVFYNTLNLYLLVKVICKGSKGAFMLNFWGQNQRFQTWLEQNAVASMLIFE